MRWVKTWMFRSRIFSSRTRSIACRLASERDTPGRWTKVFESSRAVEDLAHPGSILEVNPPSPFNPRNEPPCEGSHNRAFVANAIDCDVFVPNQGFQFLPSSRAK